MTCGIYKITCTGNGRFYIGSSVNIEKRMGKHKSQLKHGRHENIHMQRSYNKYGINSFVYTILQIVYGNDILLNVEQKYIDELMPKFNIGKQASGGDNLTNHPNRSEIIKKMTEGVRNRFAIMDDEERKKKYGHPMESNGRWAGGKTFCECGERISSTAQCCRKCIDRNGEHNSFYGKKHSEEIKEKIRQKKIGCIPKNRRPLQINGIHFCSQASASRYFGVSIGTISNWVLGKVKKATISIQKCPF